MAISKRLRFEILRRDGHRCFYCHDSEKKLTVDHVVPVALGGTDDPTNLAAACGDCNGGKSSTQPDAPLVARVHDDAMRWQMAWNAAVAEAERDGERRKKDIAKVRRSYVTAYRGRYDDDPIIPEGWESSVGRWLDLGAPLALIDKAIAASVGRAIRRDGRWNYFAGCCWGMIRDLGDRAKQLADAAGITVETWEQRFNRTVLDSAVLVWTDAYMASTGDTPSAEDVALVRKGAESLFPEQVGAGPILYAAWTVGDLGDTDITHALAASDYLAAEPFHVRVAEWLLTGWVGRDGASGNPLTPELFANLLRQACAARDAGYQEDHIFSAATVAGRRGCSLIDSLPTAAFCLTTDSECYDREIEQSALSQQDLDRIAGDAWKSEAQRKKRAAEQAAAGNPWYRDHPDYVPVSDDAPGQNGGE